MRRQTRIGSDKAELAFDVTQEIDPWFTEFEQLNADATLTQADFEDVEIVVDSPQQKPAIGKKR